MLRIKQEEEEKKKEEEEEEEKILGEPQGKVEGRWSG